MRLIRRVWASGCDLAYCPSLGGLKPSPFRRRLQQARRAISLCYGGIPTRRARGVRDPLAFGGDHEVARSALSGEVALRVRDLMRDICGQHDVKILKGHVSKESFSREGRGGEPLRRRYGQLRVGNQSGGVGFRPQRRELEARARPQPQTGIQISEHPVRIERSCERESKTCFCSTAGRARPGPLWPSCGTLRAVIARQQPANSFLHGP